MAPPVRRNRPARTLVGLGVIVLVMFGAIFAGTRWSNATWTPKLALDLEGGTQIILSPVAADPSKISDATINQAIAVIRQRVDASGVSEAEISSQSGHKIVVALPGTPSEDTLNLVRTSAQMEFRPVLQVGNGTPATSTVSASATSTDAATAGSTSNAQATANAASGAATSEATAGASDSTAASDSATAGATDTAGASPSADATAAATPSPSGTGPTSNSDAGYYVTAAVQAAFDKLDCSDKSNLTGGLTGDADKAFVTCSQDGTEKYILGPVDVEGKHIASANSGLETLSNGQQGTNWVVNLKFDSTGTTQFAAVSERLVNLTSPQNQFGIVLDGLVISAPKMNEVIPNGQAQISGSFTRESAATLAQQLSFGALPISFTVESEEKISATLGSEQLEKGLLAGLIGLVLVVVYSALQYRVLSVLTVGSLVVAAILNYAAITILSWTQGYRLSLAGVAGLIVAIGITADSFIVYFERIRDELRDGRSLGAAVDHGWDRAKRTILASDTVNFIAAVVLYVLAVGGVRGFAFTLGLTTVIDLVVVFLFTHPMMRIIAEHRFFADGHPASGLDPRRLGVTRYAGRGRVSRPVAAAAGTDEDADSSELVGAQAVPGSGRAGRTGRPTAGADAPPAGDPTMTIAERRRAARAAARIDAQVDDAVQPASDHAPDPTDDPEQEVR